MWILEVGELQNAGFLAARNRGLIGRAVEDYVGNWLKISVIGMIENEGLEADDKFEMGVVHEEAEGESNGVSCTRKAEKQERGIVVRRDDVLCSGNEVAGSNSDGWC